MNPNDRKPPGQNEDGSPQHGDGYGSVPQMATLQSDQEQAAWAGFQQQQQNGMALLAQQATSAPADNPTLQLNNNDANNVLNQSLMLILSAAAQQEQQPTAAAFSGLAGVAPAPLLQPSAAQVAPPFAPQQLFAQPSVGPGLNPQMLTLLQSLMQTSPALVAQLLSSSITAPTITAAPVAPLLNMSSSLPSYLLQSSLNGGTPPLPDLSGFLSPSGAMPAAAPSAQSPNSNAVALQQPQNAVSQSLVSSTNTSTSATHFLPPASLPPAKKRREKHTRPRRPLNAYNLFFKDERANILAERESSKTEEEEEDGIHTSLEAKRSRRRRPHGKVGFEEMAKMIGSRWKEISPERKAHYEAGALAEKERYRSELALCAREENEEREEMRAQLEASVSDEVRRQYFSKSDGEQPPSSPL